MKVLFVGAGYPPDSRGGTEVHQRDLAMALIARGHEVRVFARTGDAAVPEFSVRRREFEGVEVDEVGYRFSDVRGVADVLVNPRIDEAFMPVLDRAPVDLVHIHHLTGLSTGILDRLAERGIPTVLTLHDFWLSCLRGQRITPELERCETLDRERCSRCLARLWPHFEMSGPLLLELDQALRARLLGVGRLIAPSQHHRSRFAEFGIDPSRIEAIPHGLDLARIPARIGPVRPRRRIGFLGSVIPTKGVHVLIEAMNRLGRPELETHIYGEAPSFHGDQGYLERLRAQARADLRWHWHGSYSPDDLPRILTELDVLVVPSVWWESFCLTLREGMAAGLPVIASDLGAMHEALADTGEPVLFRPGDADDLAHKIAAVVDDDTLANRASAFRDRVRTLEQMAIDTERVYRALAGNPERKRAHLTSIAPRKHKGAPSPYATVFIPTWNGGELFRGVLDKVLAQKTTFDYEILIIDSGSTDGTLELVKSHPRVRLVQIPNHEFNHGLTRNRAVLEARGEIVALLTHDAEPWDEHWLESLVGNFDDPDVAGAYCHQVPRPDCNPWQRDRLQGWTHGEGNAVQKRLAHPDQWASLHPFDRYRLIAFDDVASCVRKSVMDSIPFERRQFGEDVAWGKEAILAGHTLVMDPKSVVIHSHERPIFYEFKRVYLDHANLNDLVGLQTVPTLWHVAKFSVAASMHLGGVIGRAKIPLAQKLFYWLKTPLYGMSQNLAQYLGAKASLAGKKGAFGKLDAWLRRGV